MKRTYLYRHFDGKGNLLYVGISVNAFVRLSQHKGSGWFNSIANVTLEAFPSRDAAIKAEQAAILKEKPQHNIRHQSSSRAIEHRAPETEEYDGQKRIKELSRISGLNAAECGNLILRNLSLFTREGDIGDVVYDSYSQIVRVLLPK